MQGHGHLQGGTHPHYRHCPSCNSNRQRFWGPVSVDFLGCPGSETGPISRVVKLLLLLDYGEAGEGACVDWPGVDQGKRYVYGANFYTTLRSSSHIVVCCRTYQNYVRFDETMKLKHIRIQNFRSIKKCDLGIDKVIALVGENNSGKSAILRALNAFFNYQEEEQDFILGKHQYSAKAKPKVTLTFFGDKTGFAAFTDHDYLAVEVEFNQGKRVIKVKQTGKFKSSSDQVIDAIKSKIDYYFIPPIRDHKNLEWASTTVFRRLAEDYLYKATEKRDNYTPKFKGATDYLEKNGFAKLGQYIHKMYHVRSNFDFKLTFPDDPSFIQFIGGLKFMVAEGAAEHEISECGTGVQSLTIIALHRALAAINGKSVILGLEEPETNLHPQAQREVIRSLKKNIDDADDLVNQVIFTTHSTIMIDSVDHTDVVLFRKIDDTTRGFQTLVTQVPSDFYQKYDVEEQQYYQFHHYRNSDFFYAKVVVVVESKNDGQVIQELMRKEGYELDDLGVSILSLDGVSNLTYAVSLIRELGLPSLVVVDKDFFLPYEKDSQDESRDANGFPKYRKAFSTDRLTQIKTLLPNQKDRDQLLPLLWENHTKAMDFLAKHGVVCMKWAMEIDLANSTKGRELMGKALKLPPGDPTAKRLLIDFKKKLKRVEVLTTVVRDLPKKNYPHSLSKICELLGGLLERV